MKKIFDMESTEMLLGRNPYPCIIAEVLTDENKKPQDFKFIYANSSMLKLLGTVRENVIDKKGSEVLSAVNKEYLEKFYEAAYESRSSIFPASFKEGCVKFTITAYPVCYHYCACIFEDITGITGTADNIATEKQKRFFCDTKIDSLTGLYNNAYLQKYRISMEAEDAKTAGIVYFDINNLKKINAEYGHDYGDKVMVNFAKYLKETFQEMGSVIFRTGGDEFMAVCLNCSHGWFEASMCMIENDIRSMNNIAAFKSVWSSDKNEIKELMMKAVDKINQ